jgi:hypothetical protein
MKRRILPLLTLSLAFVIFVPQFTFAQNFSTDARRIGLGGAGDSQNIASKLVEEQQDYKSIPIPLGILQVVKHKEVFDPDDENFDPVRAVEYAAAPLHWTLKRDSTGPGNLLVRNIVDAELNRDLNTYRGFSPAQHITAQGLIAPSWGKTFHVSSNPDGGFHGVFVGVGPYLTVGTNLSFDQKLIDLLASPTNKYSPNTNFLITDTTTGQAAASLTGGYRGRFAPSGEREGIYIAANYSYLYGLHYDAADTQLRFDTDATGLITLQPSTTPATVNRTSSSAGKGFAIDAAVAVVKEKWDASFGVDGIGNRIDWEDLGGRRYTLNSLFNGGDFVTTGFAVSSSTARVTLPVRYSGAGGYHTTKWSAATELGRGLQGFHFNGGAEYKLGPLAFRGGTRYSREIWHGATGIGLNVTKGFGIDVAAFQTSTNIENERRISIALSLRINRSVAQ